MFNIESYVEGSIQAAAITTILLKFKMFILKHYISFIHS